MVNQKKVLKQLIKFARREYVEKRPMSIGIRKVKEKITFKRGFLPSLFIKEHQLVQFIVMVEYIDHFRIYLFSTDGTLIGGDTISKKSNDISKIINSSQKLYQIPRKINDYVDFII